MGVPSFIGDNTMFPEKPEKTRPRIKRFGVEFEEERAWVGFYRRVRHDAALATEVLAQLEADAEMKRTHLALVLCCKESLRDHKARQARNKRIGEFVRWLCHGMFSAPKRVMRSGVEIAVECLPEAGKEPAVRQVRRLKREPEFAQAQSAFESKAASSAAASVAAETEASSPRSPQAQATTKAA
jgi:hypothetical protein